MPHENGIVSRPARTSVDQTVERILALLKEKGITVFAVVDHSGEAGKVGLSMRPTKLVIFGNPKAGTPVMLAAPSAAIDLPLKLLVWEDADGVTQISYNAPEFLAARHGIPAELVKNIAAAGAIAELAAG